MRSRWRQKAYFLVPSPTRSDCAVQIYKSLVYKFTFTVFITTSLFSCYDDIDIFIYGIYDNMKFTGEFLFKTMYFL